ncbi:MAG: hypothetical protein B7Z37_25615 [Verrucomicrobia bacterium 12-59-8]|nr:MAG: hypothetical protein B7Z37_25615 [Verrucomicrobia bacterium 12-59-8]
MSYSIRIHMEDASSLPSLGPRVRTVEFSLLDPVNVTNRLFVVQRVPAENEDGYLVEYQTIATAADLDNLPEDAPGEDPWSFYRVDSITLSADVPENPDGQDMIDDFITMLRRRVKSLLTALKRFETPDVRDITITV